MSAFVFSRQAVQRVTSEAWEAAFLASGQSCPHSDDDAEGDALRGMQRRFLVEYLSISGAALVECAVSAGLWPSPESFFEALDKASGGIEP